MRLKQRLLAFSQRLHARIRKTRYMHKIRCVLINRRRRLLAMRLLWNTPICPSNSRFPRVCAKCLLKLKRLVSFFFSSRRRHTRFDCDWSSDECSSDLPDLGADAIIPLNQPDQGLTAAFLEEARRGHFDIILDYLWGHPTEVLLDALTGHDLRAESTRSRLVEIGEMAGPTISLSAAALRSSGLELYGSGGGGSMPHTAIIDAFPQLLALAADGTLHIDTEPVALADVEHGWQREDVRGRRIVLIP